MTFPDTFASDVLMAARYKECHWISCQEIVCDHYILLLEENTTFSLLMRP